ncbi:MAG: hypothetical protein IID54_02170, partial [Proteobacteria bacterium]|nr:hypothetical protein [Pseudomonadota bacterium]
MWSRTKRWRKKDEGRPRQFLGIRLAAVCEAFILFGFLLAVDAFLGAGDRFFTMQPHPFWVPVLLIAAQYGLENGLFAAAVASIALLGFGAGGTLLAVLQHRVRSHFTAIFALSAMLFGLSAPLSFLLVQALPFNPLAVIWDPGQLLYLPAMYLLLVIPFFCGATCIGLAFVCYGDKIDRIYAINLMGSAAGALGIVAALFVLHPSDNLRLIAGLGFISSALVTFNRRRILGTALSAGSVILALTVLTILPDDWFALRISQYKGLPGALKVSGAKVLSERSGPLGSLSVVENQQVPFRYVPGLSLNAPTPPPPQLGVFIDGDSMTAITRFDGRREGL